MIFRTISPASLIFLFLDLRLMETAHSSSARIVKRVETFCCLGSWLDHPHTQYFILTQLGEILKTTIFFLNGRHLNFFQLEDNTNFLLSQLLGHLPTVLYQNTQTRISYYAEHLVPGNPLGFLFWLNISEINKVFQQKKTL